MPDYIAELRKRVGNMKIIVPGVRALILDDDGRLLLTRQREFESWSLPHGCIDVGESARQAIDREVHEETGITIRSARLFGVYSDPSYSVTYPNGDQVQTLSIAFVVNDWTGVPRPDDIEVSEIDFFALDRLPREIYAIHEDTIGDYRREPGGVILR